MLEMISSVQFSCSVDSDSQWPHGLQYSRLPSPSPFPGANSNSMLSKHLILCHPILLPASIFPSIRVFYNESVLRVRWSKYWSFSFNISPFNEHPGLISFRMDWLDPLAVQGTLKSLLQHHSSKASILWCSGFFTRTPAKFSHKTSRGCHCHSGLGAPACSASRTHPRNSMFLLLLLTANKRNSPPTLFLSIAS